MKNIHIFIFQRWCIFRCPLLVHFGCPLTIEWNAKEAEKYYSQALAWFRKAREKRDALSLYAAMNDDLKKQSVPTQKPTTLNQWKRIVYHDEDPLKLYNTANAPVWYVDDKEKNCIYVLGFLAFADGKYDNAKQYWEKILSLSPDIAAVDQRLPNVQSRLLQACRMNAMAFWPEEKAFLKQSGLRLKFLNSEYLILIEQFDEAIKGFEKLAKTSDIRQKALAYIGMLIAVDLTGRNGSKEKAEEFCNWKKNMDTKNGRFQANFTLIELLIIVPYKMSILA